MNFRHAAGIATQSNESITITDVLNIFLYIVCFLKYNTSKCMNGK